MLTFVLAYLGGVLTILSPCVLPVVPLIFARSDQPFRKSGLPLLAGMSLSFATFAALSVAGGHWVVHANQIGRTLALIIFMALGLSLLFTQVAERLTAPIVRLGNTLQSRIGTSQDLVSSLILGASVGLLWAPCAGPILGLVLAGASLGGSNSKTFLLLLAFALGAATSLGVAIFAGGRGLQTLKRGLGAQEWIKRALGVAVLMTVAVIALHLDTRLLAKISYVNTGALEQTLVDRVSNSTAVSVEATVARNGAALADEGPMPTLDGAAQWLNSAPLSTESLRGKVVLIDFWTYSCINCLRTLPYLKAWEEKYGEHGLVVIGVHTPEFAFEKDADKVANAVRELGIHYPVALDNDAEIWTAFHNRYWPAHYLVDTNGRVRHHHFGEGGYEESELVIQELLGEQVSSPVTPGEATGTQACAGVANDISPETYLGYSRQQGFASLPDIKPDLAVRYVDPNAPALNHWNLSGIWTISSQMASLETPGGTLSVRFRARDLHLVIGPAAGASIRYRVTIDGQAPGNDHGVDIDAAGNGTAREHRLYQLVRQAKAKEEGEHTFRIEFLDPGAQVYAFTFG